MTYTQPRDETSSATLYDASDYRTNGLTD